MLMLTKVSHHASLANYVIFFVCRVGLDCMSTSFYLKLYFRYEYAKLCMINRIWGLKQLKLQVNGHAWFHLQRLRWPVGNGEEAKKFKMKIYVSSGIRTHTASPRQESQRLRPLGHECLMVVSCLMSYRIMGYNFLKPVTWQHVSTWLWLRVYLNWMSREKEGDLIQSYDKTPIPTENSKTKGQHIQTLPKTSITQRLRTDLGRTKLSFLISL